MHLAKGLQRTQGHSLAGAIEGGCGLLPPGLRGVRGGLTQREVQGCAGMRAPISKGHTFEMHTRAVVLKLDCALESTGDFKTLLLEPHAQF